VGVRKLGIGKLNGLFANDPMVRRRTAKNLSFFLKVRALWRFLFHYVLAWVPRRARRVPLLRDDLDVRVLDRDEDHRAGARVACEDEQVVARALETR